MDPAAAAPRARAVAIPHTEVRITGPVLGRGSYGIATRGLVGEQPACFKELHLLQNHQQYGVSRAAALGSPEFREFLQEMGTMQGLRHPNILALLGVVNEHAVSEQPVYIVTELANGSLAQFLEAGTLSPGDFWALMADCLAGLVYLHTRTPPVQHRDLKPENVLVFVDPDTHALVAKLADFGISKPLPAAGALQTAVGSPRYRAPEIGLASERAAYSTQVDMYSFGVMLADSILAFTSSVRSGEVTPGDAEPRPGLLQLAVRQFPQPEHAIQEARRRLQHLWPQLVPVLDGCVERDPAARMTAAAAFEALSAPFVRPFALACSAPFALSREHTTAQASISTIIRDQARRVSEHELRAEELGAALTGTVVRFDEHNHRLDAIEGLQVPTNNRLQELEARMDILKSRSDSQGMWLKLLFGIILALCALTIAVGYSPLLLHNTWQFVSGMPLVHQLDLSEASLRFDEIKQAQVREANSLSNEARTLAERVSDFEHATEAFRGKLEESNHRISAVQGLKASLTADIQATAVRVIGLGNEQAALRLELDNVITRGNDIVSALHDAQASAESYFSNSTTRLVRLEVEQADVRAEVGTVLHRVIELEQAQVATESQCSSSESKYARLESEQSSLWAQLNGSISKTDSTYISITLSQANIQSNFSDVFQRLADFTVSLEQSQAAFATGANYTEQQRLTDVELTQAALQVDFGALVHRLVELEQSQGNFSNAAMLAIIHLNSSTSNVTGIPHLNSSAVWEERGLLGQKISRLQVEQATLRSEISTTSPVSKKHDVVQAAILETPANDPSQANSVHAQLESDNRNPDAVNGEAMVISSSLESEEVPVQRVNTKGVNVSRIRLTQVTHWILAAVAVPLCSLARLFGEGCVLGACMLLLALFFEDKMHQPALKHLPIFNRQDSYYSRAIIIVVGLFFYQHITGFNLMCIVALQLAFRLLPLWLLPVFGALAGLFVVLFVHPHRLQSGNLPVSAAILCFVLGASYKLAPLTEQLLRSYGYEFNPALLQGAFQVLVWLARLALLPGLLSVGTRQGFLSAGIILYLLIALLAFGCTEFVLPMEFSWILAFTWFRAALHVFLFMFHGCAVIVASGSVKLILNGVNREHFIDIVLSVPLAYLVWCSIDSAFHLGSSSVVVDMLLKFANTPLFQD